MPTVPQFLSAQARAGESPWHPVEAGCHEQSVAASLRAWHETPRSTSSLRFAVEPDTGAPEALDALLATDVPVGRDFDSGLIMRLHATTLPCPVRS